MKPIKQHETISEDKNFTISWDDIGAYTVIIDGYNDMIACRNFYELLELQKVLNSVIKNIKNYRKTLDK